MKMLSWIFRIFLGVLITGAGIGKILDIPGFMKVIETYEFGLPIVLTGIIAVGVSLFEIFLGLWILSGRYLATAALWSTAMHIGYFLLLITSLLRGLQLKNCGCFGVFLARPLTWYSPVEDLILIGISLALYLLAKSDKIKQL